MPVRGLVFDLYGTLVTRGEGWRAYRELIYKTLPPWAWRRARRAALTQPIPTLAAFREHFEARWGPPPEHFDRLLAEGLAAVDLVEGCVATLERARERGLKLALLSNLAAPYKRPVFELGLDRHFDVLVFSCDVGMAKPEPAIFEHAAARLGLGLDELIMIGDSRHDDVRGAREAGMRALHVDPRGRGDIRRLAELLDHPLLLEG
ncbi:HAD family hydrolase [Nannocystaceae bacterium ST9]